MADPEHEAPPPPPEPVIVRGAAPADEDAWRHLWGLYLDFYETHLPDEITRNTWRRILDPTSHIFARVAEVGGTVAGFAVCVTHERSWTDGLVCHLEDLFVDPRQRGAGIGKALIDDVLALSQAAGWSTLYWHTSGTNERARRLYDRFGSADDTVRYRIMLR